MLKWEMEYMCTYIRVISFIKKNIRVISFLCDCFLLCQPVFLSEEEERRKWFEFPKSLWCLIMLSWLSLTCLWLCPSVSASVSASGKKLSFSFISITKSTLIGFTPYCPRSLSHTIHHKVSHCCYKGWIFHVLLFWILCSRASSIFYYHILNGYIYGQCNPDTWKCESFWLLLISYLLV